MATPSSAGESLRLAEHYRGLTDEELIELAYQKKALTDAAQHALAAEIISRNLTVPPPSEPPAQARPSPPDLRDHTEPYAEDRQLLHIRTVWSEADAWRLQQVLDAWGIPFYMGLEKATSVDKVTSSFALGVPVGVMRIGVPWASRAMQNYFPKDERPEPSYEDAGDVAIHCTKCRSTDVIFKRLVRKSPNGAVAEPRFRWTCASCGHKWEDEGIETR